MDGAAGNHLGMTTEPVGDVGGLSTWAQPVCLSKLMLQESGAAPMDRLLCRFRGRETTWDHTRDFDSMAAWLSVRTSKSATCQLLGVAWRAVGSIITRVNHYVEATDRLIKSAPQGTRFPFRLFP